MVDSEVIVPELRLYLCRILPSHLSEAFSQRCGGGVTEVCIFDPTRHHHLCELTPSYMMHVLYLSPDKWPEDEQKREALSEELMTEQADCEDFGVHVRDVDLAECKVLPGPTAQEWQELLEYHDGDEKDAYEEWMNGRIEHYKANCPH